MTQIDKIKFPDLPSHLQDTRYHLPLSIVSRVFL